MKRLWAAAALAPLSFAASLSAATAAKADTTVSNTETTPLQTSSTGNITVDSGAAVALTGTTTPSATITINSAASLTNDGTISDYEATTGDTTFKGIITGPYANGSDRIAVDVVSGGGSGTSITNAGTINVVGEDSAGIAIAAEISGALFQTGTINVRGGNYGTSDVTYGIDATAKIDGDVELSGTITAQGQYATAAALADVGGGVTIDGTVDATGFRSETAATNPLFLEKLNADDFLQGGPAVELAGNITQGIAVTAYVAATSTADEIPEGEVTVHGAAPAILIGGANSIAIGANGGGYSLSIDGQVTGDGDYAAPGNVTRPYSGTAIQIGGSNPLPVTESGVGAGSDFGTVDLSSGIEVSGHILASAETHYSGMGDATGIWVGANAAVSGLQNTGVIIATSASNALASGASAQPVENDILTGAATIPVTASAVRVDNGGSLTTIVNAGVISASITGIPTARDFAAAGGVQGQAVAIDDRSSTGDVSVVNTGVINASVTPIAEGQTVDAANTEQVAIYLANGAGSASVTQDAFTGNYTGNLTTNGGTPAQAKPTGVIVGNVTGYYDYNPVYTPWETITGDVVFGNASMAPSAITGSESLDMEAGTLTGSVIFNGVGANSLTVNGGSTITGALTQAAPGDLAINVNDGLLNMTAPTTNRYEGPTASIGLSSLHVGSSGQVIFTLDSAVHAAPFVVAGTATLDSGAQLGVRFTSFLTPAEAATPYGLIQATTLNVAGSTSSLVTSLPYIYSGAVSNSGGNLDLAVSIKTPAQLHLDSAQTAAFTPIMDDITRAAAASSADEAIETALLTKTTRSSFEHFYNQFLPDYSGGPFEALLTGQEEVEAAEAEAPIKLQTDTNRGWVQEIGYLAERSDSSSATGYNASGMGLSMGAEHAHGDNTIGVAGSYLTNSIANSTQTNVGSLSATAFEAGVYWRYGGSEGLNVHAAVNGGYTVLGEHRLLLDQTAVGAATLYREAKAQWSGALASGDFGLSYQITRGRFYMRPEVSADYTALFEGAYTERGASALALAVGSRTDKQASAQADMVFGWYFGDAILWRPEIMIGYKQIVSGGPGATVARFTSGGSSFTLSPGFQDNGGVVGRLGFRASGTYADFSANAGAEVRPGYETFDAGARARFLF